MEKVKTATEVTVEDLQKKYEEFLKDNSNIDKVKAQGLTWLSNGFIIEMFIPDFSDRALIKFDNDPDVYRRYTGIAKILAASPLNDGERAKLKEGDIVYIGDDMSNMNKNPAYLGWINAQPHQVKDKTPPVEFIRKAHRYIEMGMLFLVNRGKVTASKRGLEVSLETIGQMQEPLVFRVPPADILYKIDNPWA